MDISRKYRLVEKLILTEDDTLLKEIQALLGLSDEDFWDDLPNEVKWAIDKAKDELDKGEGIPDNQIAAEVREKYFKK